MKIAELYAPEFDREMATTRTLLERVPEEKSDWKPHTKSYSLGQLAAHIANIPRWAYVTMETTELDFASPLSEQYRTPKFETTTKLLEVFDRNVAAARERIAGASDDDYQVLWSLKNGAHIAFTAPRFAAVRSFILNHGVHHRGALSVYLRQLEVKLPSIYGPTADM